MTTHITKEQACVLSRECGLDWQRGFVVDDVSNRYEDLCNAAIQHYIDSHPADRIADAGKTIDRAALEQLLDVLEEATGDDDCGTTKTRLAITAGRAALAQPQGEVVGAQCRFKRGSLWDTCSVEHHEMVQRNPEEWKEYETRLVYTHPQASEPAPEVDGLGIPLSCGKPLCSPRNHHPLCDLASEPAPSTAGERTYMTMQGLASYLRAEAVGVRGIAQDTLRQWASEVDAALQSTAQPDHIVDVNKMVEQPVGELTDEQAVTLYREAQDQGLTGIHPGVYMIRAILASAKAQPVGLTDQQKHNLVAAWFSEGWAMQAAYGMIEDYETIAATKAQPERKPLTELQIEKIFATCHAGRIYPQDNICGPRAMHITETRAIEAAHGIKGGQQ